MSESFYDSAMAAQQDRLSSTPDMIEQRERIIAALRPESGENVLELGTGNGALLRDLLPHISPEGQLIGIDSSQEMLDIAGQIAPGVELMLGSAENLPFEDQRFDAVCAAQLLCFLSDADRALSEAFRVLRPGGRVVLLDTDWATLVWHNRNPDLMRRVVSAYTSHYVDPHVPRTLGPRLAATGFDSIACESLVVLNRLLSEDTYVRQTLGFAVPIMQNDPRFTDEDIALFVEDQEALDAEGATFFSLNRYVFQARKMP